MSIIPSSRRASMQIQSMSTSPHIIGASYKNTQNRLPNIIHTVYYNKRIMPNQFSIPESTLNPILAFISLIKKELQY